MESDVRANLGALFRYSTLELKIAICGGIFVLAVCLGCYAYTTGNEASGNSEASAVPTVDVVPAELVSGMMPAGMLKHCRDPDTSRNPHRQTHISSPPLLGDPPAFASLASSANVLCPPLARQPWGAPFGSLARAPPAVALAPSQTTPPRTAPG